MYIIIIIIIIIIIKRVREEGGVGIFGFSVLATF